MLEETPDDADDANPFRAIGKAGAQTADPAHDEVDLRRRRPTPVELVDDLGVDEAFILAMIRAG